MELKIRVADGKLPERDREYAEKKLGKLDRYFNAASKVEIAYTQMKRGHQLDVTVFADGLHLHAQETDEAIHAAIDRIADKLENRLRRQKSRIVKAFKKAGRPVPEALDEVEAVALDEEPEVIREERRFVMKPMSLEEAVLQIELSDRPFFLFRNQDTDRPELLYKMEGGGFGLLVPEG